MQKIREVAKLLNVETVEIHKKLIALKKELSPYVHKVNGITFIDEIGIDIISLSFSGRLNYVDLDAIHNEENVETVDGDDFSSSDVEENCVDDFGAEEKSDENNDVLEGELIKDEENSEQFESFEDLEGLKEEIEKIKTEIGLKKRNLNAINQKIVSELHKTKNYTQVLADLQKRIEQEFYQQTL